VFAGKEPLDSSIAVIVDDVDSAEAVLGWALHQGRRRHSRVCVLYLPTFPYAGDVSTLAPWTIEQGQKQLIASLDYLGAGSRASLHIGGPEESTTEAIRANALRDPQGLLMVGPLDKNTLVKLVFGSGPHDVGHSPELPVVVVPRSAWSTALPCSTPSKLTVGFHGSDPAGEALAWAVGEADRRSGVVRAVMAWCEGDYGELGGPVPILARPSTLVSRSADKLAADSLSRCGVPTDRVSAIARRGMPASILIQEATGSDLLTISAGQSTVFGHRTLGAVTWACVTRSPVPVVIVPSYVGDDRLEVTSAEK
jgi:nucleotide-binding universal stress UspA family protein